MAVKKMPMKGKTDKKAVKGAREKKGKGVQKDYTALLGNVNDLLAAVGITTKKITSIQELTRVASSMFVAVFEALFHVRLTGIVRQPTKKEDYEFNVQRVIDGLGAQINMNLQHIPGRAIVQGDIRALSNLVHIFVHFCPKINEGGKSGKPFEVTDGLLQNDLDSISTHESTFEQTGAVTETGDDQFGFTSTSRVKELVEEDARQLLLRTEAQIHQSERIEAARRRRDQQRSNIERKLNAENRRKAAVTTKVQQRRWLEEAIRQGDSFELRQSSEEHAMLRKIYQGLLNKLHVWRRAERQEAREKVGRMRGEARGRIEALQNLFEDRLKLLAEQNTANRRDEELHRRAHRRMDTDLLRSYNGRQKRITEIHKSALNQKRQHTLLSKHESHKNLLALLGVEDWTTTLRNTH